jgi:hypothetical protein
MLSKVDCRKNTRNTIKLFRGEMESMPTGKVFNFADNEENYFAVTEKK